MKSFTQRMMERLTEEARQQRPVTQAKYEYLLREARNRNVDIPPEFLDPTTQTLMVDPVKDSTNNIIRERSLDPPELNPHNLKPCVALQNRIVEFVKHLSAEFPEVRQAAEKHVQPMVRAVEATMRMMKIEPIFKRPTPPPVDEEYERRRAAEAARRRAERKAKISDTVVSPTTNQGLLFPDDVDSKLAKLEGREDAARREATRMESRALQQISRVYDSECKRLGLPYRGSSTVAPLPKIGGSSSNKSKELTPAEFRRQTEHLLWKHKNGFREIAHQEMEAFRQNIIIPASKFREEHGIPSIKVFDFNETALQKMLKDLDDKKKSSQHHHHSSNQSGHSSSHHHQQHHQHHDNENASLSGSGLSPSSSPYSRRGTTIAEDVLAEQRSRRKSSKYVSRGRRGTHAKEGDVDMDDDTYGEDVLDNSGSSLETSSRQRKKMSKQHSRRRTVRKSMNASFENLIGEEEDEADEYSKGRRNTSTRQVRAGTKQHRRGKGKRKQSSSAALDEQGDSESLSASRSTEGEGEGEGNQSFSGEDGDDKRTGLPSIDRKRSHQLDRKRRESEYNDDDSMRSHSITPDHTVSSQHRHNHRQSQGNTNRGRVTRVVRVLEGSSDENMSHSRSTRSSYSSNSSDTSSTRRYRRHHRPTWNSDVRRPEDSMADSCSGLDHANRVRRITRDDTAMMKTAPRKSLEHHAAADARPPPPPPPLPPPSTTNSSSLMNTFLRKYTAMTRLTSLQKRNKEKSEALDAEQHVHRMQSDRGDGTEKATTQQQKYFLKPRPPQLPVDIEELQRKYLEKHAERFGTKKKMEKKGVMLLSPRVNTLDALPPTPFYTKQYLVPPSTSQPALQPLPPSQHRPSYLIQPHVGSQTMKEMTFWRQSAVAMDEGDAMHFQWCAYDYEEEEDGEESVVDVPTEGEGSWTEDDDYTEYLHPTTLRVLESIHESHCVLGPNQLPSKNLKNNHNSPLQQQQPPFGATWTSGFSNTRGSITKRKSSYERNVRASLPAYVMKIASM